MVEHRHGELKTWWNSDTVNLWHGGTLTRWTHDMVEHWHSELMTWWTYDMVEHWHGELMTWWTYDVVEHRHGELWHGGSLTRWTYDMVEHWQVSCPAVLSQLPMVWAVLLDVFRCCLHVLFCADTPYFWMNSALCVIVFQGCGGLGWKLFSTTMNWGFTCCKCMCVYVCVSVSVCVYVCVYVCVGVTNSNTSHV